MKNLKYYIFCLILLIIIHYIAKLTAHFYKKNKLIITKMAKSKYKVRQVQLETLQHYTNNLEELYWDMRKFKHDYLNIILSIGGFINDNDMPGLSAYFNNTIYPLNEKMQFNNIKLGLLGNLKIPELKGLFSSKLIKAHELKLNVSIDIAEPIYKIDLDIIDCIRAVGILLDNAIEAAINTDEKQLSLVIVNTNSAVKIIVLNSYAQPIPSISKLFKKGYSTKGDNRGLGLSILRDILNRNSKVLLDTSIKNNKFTQILTIQKIHGID